MGEILGFSLPVSQPRLISFLINQMFFPKVGGTEEKEIVSAPARHTGRRGGGLLLPALPKDTQVVRARGAPQTEPRPWLRGCTKHHQLKESKAGIQLPARCRSTCDGGAFPVSLLILICVKFLTFLSFSLAVSTDSMTNKRAGFPLLSWLLCTCFFSFLFVAT